MRQLNEVVRVMRKVSVFFVAAAASLASGIACGSSNGAAPSSGGGAGAGGVVASAGGAGARAGSAGEGGVAPSVGGSASGGTAQGASGGVAGQSASGGVGGEGGAVAHLPTSKRFDLTQPSYDLFRDKALHGTHRVMQSFAFDNENRRLFVAQLQNGTSGDDLCISELSFSGELLGYMHLDGAGHGVSIGVEPMGGDSYLWVETDSSNTTDSGRGTALLRFKFESGKQPTGTKFLTGSKTITCATDPVNQRIAIRRNEGGRMFYSVFSLARAAAGDFGEPLARFPQPPLSDTSVVFQGYTIFGQYLYTLDGTGHADAADIDSYVTAIDMLTGEVKSRALTKAGKSLIYREPEGMAIYQTASGEPRLFFGFGSRDSLSGSDRYANVFYKNVLID